MVFRLSYFLAFSCFIITVKSAAIDNSVYDVSPRINSGKELVSSVIENCLDFNVMSCINEKVLTYLNTITGINTEGRGFDEKNVDKLIFERLGRVLATNEFHVQLPSTFFGNTVMTYRHDRGLDFELPKEEGRGDVLKKKLLLPILLLLKLKFKALLPIFVALIGIKAIKALILSKLAIKLVLGFIIYQLVQKLGAKGSMQPAPPQEPLPSYGPPTTPASDYGAPAWEPSGGPYSRVWSPSSDSSAQNLAYSSYYPGSSSSSGSSTSSSGSSSSPSSSSSYSYSP